MPLLSTEEAADYLNVTTGYIDNLITTNALTVPITRPNLEKIKKENQQQSLSARRKLCELTRHYDMGY